MKNDETKKDRGQEIYDWIVTRINEGLTVYACTYYHATKITKSAIDRGLVRYHNGHCEIARGRSWDSINYCGFRCLARK